MPMLFVQERLEDNLYARPLEGIRMKLDLWATPPAVVAFLDAQQVPLPPRDPLMNFPSTAAHTGRPPLAPLRASQPQGASFTLGPGGLLSWQGWLGLGLTLTLTLTLTLSRWAAELAGLAAGGGLQRERGRRAARGEPAGPPRGMAALLL